MVLKQSVQDGGRHGRPRFEPGRWLRRQGGAVLSRRFWERRLPVIGFVRGYDLSALLSDVIAGLTVGITFIPSGMASAVLAGLPPQYGLYSSFMCSMVYAVLGTCKDVASAPTTMIAMLCASFVQRFGASVVGLLTFCSGCFVLLLGLLQLDIIVDFISAPVISGYLSASALSIISSQIPGLMGIPGGGSTFLEYWLNIGRHIQHIQLWDSLLGLSCILLITALKFVGRYSEAAPGEAKASVRGKVYRGIFHYLCLGRNVIVLVSSTAVIAAITAHAGEPPVQIAGEVEEGFPAFKPPSFEVVYQNRTLSFGEAVTQLSSGITIPLLMIIGIISASKVFSGGKTVDTTQEMIAVGLANILGSFVQSLPVTSSITRTSVNHASGVRTPISGIFTGLVVLAAMALLTSTLKYLPRATMSAILSCAVFFLIQIRSDTATLWRSKKADLIPLHFTFIGCLFVGLDYGIIIGVAFNMLLILYDAARPSIQIQNIMVGGREVVVVTPDRSVTYPAGEHVKRAIAKRSQLAQTLVIDGTHVRQIDSTSAQVLKSLLVEMKQQYHSIIFWNWKQSVIKIFESYYKTSFNCFQSSDCLEQLIFIDPSDAVEQQK